MKKTCSVLLIFCLILACAPAAFADQPPRNAVYELYSADGYYEDGVGNTSLYSYHVPQIHASTLDAKAINAEIADRFGKRVESQFSSMESGCSLYSLKTEWTAYWSGSQLFLVIISELDGDSSDCAAYGYDFDTQSRITNEMILAQRGVSEEKYLENLREKVMFMFYDLVPPIPEGVKADLTQEKLLDQTLNWLDMDNPMFINQFGEIETIVKIVSLAGSGWFYAFATPFVYG